MTAAVTEAPPGSWFYGDSSGKVQGPFSEQQMVQWVRQGSLPASTPVVAQATPYPTRIPTPSFSWGAGNALPYPYPHP